MSIFICFSSIFSKYKSNIKKIPQLIFITIIIISTIYILLYFQSILHSRVSFFIMTFLKQLKKQGNDSYEIYIQTFSLIFILLINFIFFSLSMKILIFPGCSLYIKHQIGRQIMNYLMNRLQFSINNLKNSIINNKSLFDKGNKPDLNQVFFYIKSYLNERKMFKISFESYLYMRLSSQVKTFLDAICSFEDYEFDQLDSNNISHLTLLITSQSDEIIHKLSYLYKKCEEIKDRSILNSFSTWRDIYFLIDYAFEKDYIYEKPFFNTNIESILLKNKEKQSDFVMIICNQNSVLYQHLYFNPSIINYLLSKDIDVFLWNYHGFSPYNYIFLPKFTSFKSINSDINLIFTMLKHKKEYKKIGIWGISIGGFALSACCELFSSEIDLLIYDRNFSSIENIILNSESKLRNLKSDSNMKDNFYQSDIDYIENKSNTKVSTSSVYSSIIYILYILYKSLQYQDLPSDLIRSKVFPNLKILISDPNDEIINDKASFKSGVSSYIISNKFNTSKDQCQKIGNENISLLEYVFNNVSEYYQFSFSFINLCLVSNNSKYNQIKSHLENLDSCLNLLLNINKEVSLKGKVDFLNTFFNNLYVWGSFLIEEDIKYNIRNKESPFIESSIYKVSILIEEIHKLVNENKDANCNEDFEESYRLIHCNDNEDSNQTDQIGKDQFLHILKGLIKIKEFIEVNTLTYHEKSLSGILIPIRTGHNDKLKKEVYEKIGNYLNIIREDTYQK